MSYADLLRAYYDAPVTKLVVPGVEPRIEVCRREGYGYYVEKGLSGAPGFVDWKFEIPEDCPVEVLKAIVADREKTA
jgi:hypothetical protein